MFQLLTGLRSQLDALQPGAFNALLSLLLFGAVYLVRKFLPGVFALLPESLQAAPALAGGAVVSALSASLGGTPGQIVEKVLAQLLVGLVSGSAAVGVHHALKASPLPYGNPPPKPPAPPSSTKRVSLAAVIVAGLLLAGCTAQAAAPVIQFTCVVGSGLMPEVEALAVENNVPVALVLALYKLACPDEAPLATSQADLEHRSLASVRGSIKVVRASGAKFPAN